MADLASLPLRDFAAALASDSPAPGGGSASAAAGAAGSALLEMVVRLTVTKEKFRDVWDELKPLAVTFERSRAHLLELVDEDTRAFEAIVAARKLPKGTEAEKAARQKAIDEATVLATTVPLQTAFYAGKALAHAALLAEKGNPNASSDVLVGATLLAAAVEGAIANVRINLPGVADRSLAKGFRQDAMDLERKSQEELGKTREVARSRTLAA